MSQFQLFRNVVHIQQSVRIFKFYKILLQNLHMECRSTFQQTKILLGNFQVCDALNILFTFEKPPVEHLEGFILLPREDGELQKNFITLNRKFQLKNSKEFPHWISKSWCIDGGRNVCGSSNESLMSQPHFEGVGGHHSHSRKWDLGVLRDSQKLRARLQRSKHLALKRSLYRWKSLER